MKTRTILLFAAISAMALSPDFTPVKNISDGKWDAATLAKANTAKDAAYLTAEEKKTIQLINLSRLKPKLFAETYLQKFLDSTKMPASKWVTSLKSDLNKAQPMPVLIPQKDLYDAAKGFAVFMGKKGEYGHENYEKRIKAIRDKYKWVAENCDYGSGTALGIVMNQLIDEGMEGAGHRKNLMEPNYENIGLSIQPHKEQTYNCVIELSAKESKKSN